MKILNIGCGGVRPQDEHWTNLDDLHSQLPEGSAARVALNGERNYINFQIMPGQCLPFVAGSFDGILASHFFEHFDAQESLKLMKECHRLLKPGGILMVSVPDATYFRMVHESDRNENWPKLFGVTDPANPIPTFMEAALFFDQHKMVFTNDSLWCFLTQAGFKCVSGAKMEDMPSIFMSMSKYLNRSEFSLERLAIKQ